MVKAGESRLYSQHFAGQASKLNFMSTALRPRQQECLPACINPGTCVSSARVALPRFVVPGTPDLKTGQTNEAHGLFQCLPLQFQSLLPTPNPYHKEKQSVLSYGPDGKTLPNANSGSSPTRFLVFDQCGNQTRLIYNSGFPPVQNPSTATTKPICYYNLDKEEQVSRIGRIDPSKYFLHEESVENTHEESEFHEDTEEINALLYSDDDDDGGGDDDYGDDDEVASTGHSPSYEKDEHVEFMIEEVAGSEGPNKRQKLFDGGYKKSSPVDTATSVKLDGSLEYDSDAESGYAIGHNQGEEVGSILGVMHFKRDRIRETVRILESIIPGAEGKDPLLVIDEAIDYLKILKLKAKSLGVNHQ